MRAILRGLALPSLAALLLTAAPAEAQPDPCAGGLDPSRIVDCLKPGGLAPVMRGIRPAGPRPGPAASQAPSPQAPSEPASVNLTVNFGFDSADLTAQGRAVLDALAAALKDPALVASRFRIAGHTDAKGGDAYNLALSERRAEAARRYLVDRGGVAPSRLDSIGFGRQQLYDPANPTAAANRRVQVIRIDN